MIRSFTLMITIAAFGLCSATIFGQGTEKGELRVQSAWSCVMAGQDTEIRFFDNRQKADNNVAWYLKHGQRTLAKGTAVPVNQDRNSTNQFVVKFRIPDTAPDFVLELVLELQYGNAGHTKSLQHPVYVFSANPFDGKIVQLEKMRICLFDPVGDTRSVIDEYKIPHKLLRNLQSIEAVSDGTIIVGEGIQLSRHSGLASSLLDAAARGVNVLCLAPKSGYFEFEFKPQDQESKPVVCTKVSLVRESILKRFDSRFDTTSWSGVKCVSTRFEIQLLENEIKFATVDAKQRIAWPWVELKIGKNTNEYESKSNSPPNLTICGLGIVKNWNHGPVARHLFWKLLSISGNTLKNKSK